MALIKAKDGNNIYTWKSDNIRDAEIGNLQSLSTTAKNSLVNAINEVYGGGVSNANAISSLESLVSSLNNTLYILNNTFGNMIGKFRYLPDVPGTSGASNVLEDIITAYYSQEQFTDPQYFIGIHNHTGLRAFIGYVYPGLQWGAAISFGFGDFYYYRLFNGEYKISAIDITDLN